MTSHLERYEKNSFSCEITHLNKPTTKHIKNYQKIKERLPNKSHSHVGYLASASWFEFREKSQVFHNCSWILAVAPYQKINFTLVDFSLSPSTSSLIDENFKSYYNFTSFSGNLPISHNNYKNEKSNEIFGTNYESNEDFSDCVLYATLQENKDQKIDNGSRKVSEGIGNKNVFQKISKLDEAHKRSSVYQHHVCQASSRDSFVYTSISSQVIVTINTNHQHYFLLKYEGELSQVLINFFFKFYAKNKNLSLGLQEILRKTLMNFKR